MYKIIRDVSELVEALILKNKNTLIINGGTDFLIKYNQVFLEDKNIIDISQIKELDFILEKENHVEIGAVVNHNQISKNEIIKKYFSALSSAASDIGSEQIRNRGTLSGNIVNCSPGGDCIPVLISLESEIEILNSENKKRYESVESFVMGPGKNSLGTDEVITKIIIPKKTGYKSHFSKYALGNKKHVVIANVSLSINAKVINNEVLDAKVVLGACSYKSIISLNTMKKLIGKKINQETLECYRDAITKEVFSSVASRPEFHYKVDAMRGLSTDVFETLFMYEEDKNV